MLFVDVVCRLRCESMGVGGVLLVACCCCGGCSHAQWTPRTHTTHLLPFLPAKCNEAALRQLLKCLSPPHHPLPKQTAGLPAIPSPNKPLASPPSHPRTTTTTHWAQVTLRQFFEFLSFLSEMFVFAYLGLQVATMQVRCAVLLGW